MDISAVLAMLSRWVHIGSAIVAIGGAAFMWIALIPAVKQTLDDAKHQALHEAIRSRWSKVVHACVGLLLLTGAANFMLVTLPSKVEPMPYHPLFGVKFLAALVVFFIATALTGRAPGLEHMRRARSKWLAILLFLAALIVLLSVILGHLRTSHAA